MKIYYDTDRSLIVVEGTRDVWPPLSLTAAVKGNAIFVTLAVAPTVIAGPLRPSDIQRVDGTSFTDISAALAYLSNEFAQQHAPPTLAFPQLQPSTTWLVTHNLKAFPTVTTTDSTGEIIAGTVKYVDFMSLTITFTYPISGVTYID